VDRQIATLEQEFNSLKGQAGQARRIAAMAEMKELRKLLASLTF
jgi:hypothetical protein